MSRNGEYLDTARRGCREGVHNGQHKTLLDEVESALGGLMFLGPTCRHTKNARTGDSSGRARVKEVHIPRLSTVAAFFSLLATPGA